RGARRPPQGQQRRRSRRSLIRGEEGRRSDLPLVQRQPFRLPNSTLCAVPPVGASRSSVPVPVLPAKAPVPVSVYLPTSAAPAGPRQKVAVVSVFWSVPAGEACVSVSVPVAGAQVTPAFVAAWAMSTLSEPASA